MNTRAVIAVALLAALSGCGDKSAPAPAATAAAGPAPTFGTSTITGTIKFVGTPPARKMIDTSSCQSGPRVYQEETIIVGEGGTLADVIVYLKDAPASSGAAQPEQTLDQVGCRYTPHVLAVQAGQPLKITTSDPILHNVHWSSEKNGDDNFGLFHAGESRTVNFAKPDFVRFRCDVHPWMSGFVGVLANPFFGVSAHDGTFKISRVPAGHYTLATWHPILGEREQPIDVAADGTATATIEYAPPAAP